MTKPHDLSVYGDTKIGLFRVNTSDKRARVRNMGLNCNHFPLFVASCFMRNKILCQPFMGPLAGAGDGRELSSNLGAGSSNAEVVAVIQVGEVALHAPRQRISVNFLWMD